jgi:hypothetical protein
MKYEQNNKRSYSAGTDGAGSGRGGTGGLLTSEQSAEVHSGSVVCPSGAAGVFPPGLPRPCNVAGEVAGTACSLGPEAYTALFDALLRRGQAAEKRGTTRLLDRTLELARSRGLTAPEIRTAAVDSTGLETRHVSLHYAKRSWRHSGHWKRRYPKLSALCDIKSHLILAAVVDRGPKPDIVEFRALLQQAALRQQFQKLLGDAGYESEDAHRFCREELGVKSIIPTTIRGRPRHNGQQHVVQGKYRRQLHLNFPKKTYGQRWQIETAFSMLKRRLGSSLKRRRPFAINREVLLKVITHNLMIIHCALSTFQQSRTATNQRQYYFQMSRYWYAVPIFPTFPRSSPADASI